MENGNIVRGYSDGDVDTNLSDRPHLNTIVAERYSRRQTILGSLGATVAAFLGTSLLAACGDEANGGGGLTVNPGENAATSAGRLVTLNGSVTGGSPAGVSWTQVSGPTVELLNANANTATFIAPAVAASTPLVFRFNAASGLGAGANGDTTVTVNPAALGFDAVAKTDADIVTVPAGYSVTVMTRLGDPLAAGVSDYANDGSDTNFAQRIGDLATRCAGSASTPRAGATTTARCAD